MQAPDARILIVDDEEGIRELFKDNLQARGYRCDTAPGGAAALELMASEEYDLAILDMMMPGMSGVYLFEQIKQRWPDLAVIFVTAVDRLGLAVDNLKKRRIRLHRQTGNSADPRAGSRRCSGETTDSAGGWRASNRTGGRDREAGQPAASERDGAPGTQPNVPGRANCQIHRRGSSEPTGC